ncbi:MAG: discoidin domain-containing protein [Granulosicoccus sp.]
MEWAFYPPEAGSYRLQWRYAIENETARPARVIVNGTQQSSNVAFPATGSWSAYATTAEISVDLVKGNNRIRLEAVQADGLANIDYIEITGQDPLPGYCSAADALELSGQWGDVIQWPHVPVSMANLPDGRILTFSGSERRTWPTTEQTYSATWNPETGEFVENLFRGHNMFCAALSLTSDGRLLVNGGRNSANSPWTSLYDYRNGRWQAVRQMASGGRWYPTTVSLGDGSVMTAMGNATNVRNPDLWTPDKGWRVLNGVDFTAMRAGRGGDSIFPLLSVAPDGNIFHYWDPQRNQYIDPEGNGSFERANATSDGGAHPTGVQLMYDVGKLLVSGSNDGSWDTRASSNAFTIDLNGAVPEIRSAGNMKHRRMFHQMIPLPTGEVLIVGGNTTGTKFRDDGSVLEPEIWNPQTGTWRGVAKMAVPRDYHSTAMMLTDGRVLVGGGGYDASNPNSSGTHQDAQVFMPPYLFKGVELAERPTIVAEQASVDIGQWLEITTSEDIQAFSFIKMGATTHAVNTDTRFYRPQFEATGNNSYRVKIHENPHVAIPGYWMLFALNSDNVPSVAQVVRVTAVDTRLKNRALSGFATQSSVLDTTLDNPGNAIDGNLKGSSAAGSVTRTQVERQPWWQLDLGREIDIDTIRIWNRTDCCANELNNFHVLVSSRPFDSTELSESLAQQGVSNFPVSGVAGRQSDMEIGQSGRYIRIQLAGTGTLQLAEVEVFGETRASVSWEYYEGNWSSLPDFDSLIPIATGSNDAFSLAPARRADNFALRQSATLLIPQNGTYEFATLSDDGSQLFIDGNLVVDNNGLHDVQRRQGTVTLARGEYPVTVTYFKRDGAQSLQVLWSGPGFTDRPLVSFGEPRPLPLNLASGKPTRQSSTLEPRFASNVAVDGNARGNGRNGEITHTLNEFQPWWEVDLGEVSDIDYITLFNRTDCCAERLSSFYVHVSETPFESENLNATLAQTGVVSTRVSGANGPSRRIDLSATGRYVRVQLEGSNPLALAEVQVWNAPSTEPLNVQEISPTPMQQGSVLTLSAEATGPSPLSYSWNFGDGTADTPFSSESSAEHSYSSPGRYVLSVTVRDDNGDEVRTTFTQIVHGELTVNKAQNSSSLLELPARAQLWNTNPDNNSVSVTDTRSLQVVAEIPVDKEPVALVSGPDNRVWVVNRNSATISVIDPETLTIADRLSLRPGSLPYGIVSDGTHVFIALEGTGQIIRLAGNGSVLSSTAVGPNPRHLSLQGDGSTLFVSRFITPLLPGEETGNPIVNDGARAYGGELLVLATADMSLQNIIVLEHANRIPSENQGPGVPNYLGAMAISPTGNKGWLPSKQDNILSGEVRGGSRLTFDQTVRAVTSHIDLNTSTELTELRVDHDNASVAHSAAFDPYGASLFVSLEGNRQISIIDTSSAIEVGRFDTGFAPQGLLVSTDGSLLFVHNYMDRTIGVYDIAAITLAGSTEASLIDTISVVANETLDPFVLRGKQLFHDARDDRLAGLDYMSCASCHADGEQDGRVWDFTALGEGLRNTSTLQGRAGTGHGRLHWTGNFDEVQDFEGQIREFAGGTGLLNDVYFALSIDPLGRPKAGLSSDLDALAAYLSSLDKTSESPWRSNNGTLTTEALAGRQLFNDKGCASCHNSDIYTDSNSTALHDIGTIRPDSGQRLGQNLTGFDTPTLLGVWRTPPYLHDGRAATLQAAIRAHRDSSVSDIELDQLSAFLLQLDDREAQGPSSTN